MNNVRWPGHTTLTRNTKLHSHLLNSCTRRIGCFPTGADCWELCGSEWKEDVFFFFHNRRQLLQLLGGADSDEIGQSSTR